MREVGDYFPRNPEISPGFHVPLSQDIMADIETPDYQKSGIGEGPGWAPYSQRQYGSNIYELAIVESLDIDGLRREPAETNEKVRYFDRFKCVNVAPEEINLTGVVFELTRVHLPANGASILERLAVVCDSIDAVNVEGDVVFAFGPITGDRPCQTFVHPDPLVTSPLTFQFNLIREGRASSRKLGTPEPPFVVAGTQVPVGKQVREPWDDFRQGYLTRWADQLQYVDGDQSLMRLFVTITGDPDSWQVRIGGRLSGRWIGTGPTGAALSAATLQP
jgi:hypothetical protein